MGTLRDLRPKAARAPKLKPAGDLALAQAETFLAGLESRTRGADFAQAMYLLGIAQQHLARMTELVRAVTCTPAP